MGIFDRGLEPEVEETVVESDVIEPTAMDPGLMVSVDEVLNKGFHVVDGGGYNRNEVDDFLNRVAATVYNLTGENQELTDRVRSL